MGRIRGKPGGTVRIDMSRMAATAIDAALDDGKPRRRRFSGLRAMVTGAALVGLARVAVKQAPSLPRVPDLAEVGDRLRDRLLDGWPAAHDDFDDEDEYDEPVDEAEEEPYDEDDDDDGDEPLDEDDEPEDEGDEDDEPEDEGDEDDEPEDEPVDEADEDEDPQDEADDDEGRDAPGVDVSGNGRGEIDPVARPPEPPAAKKTKTKAGSR
jgi:hypothetical protein